MTWNTELRFSRDQIDKAEARLAYQTKVIDRLGPRADRANVERSKHIFDLLEDRVTRLHERHENLLGRLGEGAGPRGW